MRHRWHTRRWFRRLLDEALTAPEVDLRGLVDVEYRQVGHCYVGRRPSWEFETWMGKRTLSFRRWGRKSTAVLWEVRHAGNQWDDPDDECPFLLFETSEFFPNEEAARLRFASRGDLPALIHMELIPRRTSCRSRRKEGS